MKLSHLVLVSIISTLPTISYAIFCPTNFNQIYPGDSVDQVISQCGKPDFQETKDIEPNVPQEFNYYIPQTVPLNSNTRGQGTQKTSFSFDANGKVNNITVNGIGVGASTICGTSLRLGDTMDAVKAACGEPSFINKAQATSTTAESKDKITTLTYKSNPPAVLKFLNGKYTP